MSPIPVNLASEDQLSETVLRRILVHADREYFVGTAYGHTGYGYLRSTIRGWNAAARGRPFIVLTDLDRYPCPQALILDWLKIPINPNLVLRVAVREIEAWLLADRENFARFLSIPQALVPGAPDTLADPKVALVGLARRSRLRDIRESIVPRLGSTAQQGPDYNGCLARFVNLKWDINHATARSPSLAKAVRKFQSFEPTWPEPVSER